ncbi:hypothetical protein [Pelagicoccus albus]|uniref:Glycosyltransferase RgtA/B/C/D-like domain-containing protein n=1 Tax=Pelagicoccus albus TaxID=415222 RepID=A0A7X1E809_9BACT|nr:hypothetical protein [Pelagicoccus albus]MBC2605824.1 hypothetical protein [Pelagicoccus albus]
MNRRFQFLLVLYSLAFVCLSAFTAGDYGLSWDEPFRWRSGDKKLAYYERLASADDKLEVMSKAPNDVYPGFYDIPLAIARRDLPVDDVTLSRIWNSVFAFFLALAPVAMTRILLVSGRAESASKRDRAIQDFLPFLAGFALLCMPEVNGHLFINPKDIPFAATYGWGVVLILWIVLDLANFTWTRAVALGLVCGAAMATRPPGIALFGFLGLFIAAKAMIASGPHITLGKRLKILGGFTIKSVFSFLVAWLTMLPFWPRAHRTLLSPFAASTESVTQLKTFSSAQPVLYAGQFYEAGETPWTYSLWMFVIKQPEWVLLLLALAGIALVQAIPTLKQKVREGDGFVWGAALAVSAALLPWIYVVVSEAAIHNGFRHMFYVLPMIAMISALGARWLLLTVWEVPRWRVGSIGLLGFAMLLGLLSIIRLYPYQYMYYNTLVGGTAGAFGRYETDYWFLGSKEAFEILSDEVGESPTRIFVLGPQGVANYYAKPNMEIVENPALATHYIGRYIPEIVGNNRILSEIDRAGIPLLVVVDLRMLATSK